MSTLTNEDFKALLRKPREEILQSSRKLSEANSTKPKPQTQDSKRNDKKKFKSPEWKSKMEERKALREKYRDRAEERRKEILPKQESNEDSSTTSNTTTGNNPIKNPSILGEATGLEQANINVSIENSKYLGGDVRYTHLVKGLDYALLSKVKGEIEDLKVQQIEEEKKVEIEKSEKAKSVAPIVKSLLAERIYKFATGKDPVSQNHNVAARELFLPNRMAFVYEIDGNNEEFGFTGIPTTLLRSKADCPEPKEVISGYCEDVVYEKVQKFYSYVRQGISHKKKKKKDQKSFKEMAGEYANENSSELTLKLVSNKIQESSESSESESESVEKEEKNQGKKEEKKIEKKEEKKEENSLNIFDDDDVQQEYNTKRGKEDKTLKSHFESGSYFGKQDEPLNTNLVPEPSLEMINQSIALAEARAKFDEAQSKFKQHQEESKNKAKPEGAAGIFYGPTPTQTQKKPLIPKSGNISSYDPDDNDYGMDTGYFEEDSDDEGTLDSKQFGLKSGDGRVSKKKMVQKESQKIKQELHKINQIIDKRKRNDYDGSSSKRAHYE